MPFGSSTLGRLITCVISSDAIGSLEEFLAIPRIVRSRANDSRETELPNSELLPLRRTRICRGFPVFAKVALSPSTSASEDTSTATVSAIPATVINVVVLRTTRLRRLYAKGIFMLHPVCLSDSTIGARAAETAGASALIAEIARAARMVSAALSGVMENDRNDCTYAEP